MPRWLAPPCGRLPVVKGCGSPRPRDRLSSAGSRRCFTSWIPQAAGGKAGLFMARSLVTDSSAETEPRTLSSRWLYGRQHSAGPNRSIASPPRSLNIATALHAEAMHALSHEGHGVGICVSGRPTADGAGAPATRRFVRWLSYNSRDEFSGIQTPLTASFRPSEAESRNPEASSACACRPWVPGLRRCAPSPGMTRGELGGRGDVVGKCG